MSKKIDRAAQAIFYTFYEGAPWPPKPFDDGLRTAEDYRDAARAVMASAWCQSTETPDEDGVYLCWCDAPPQSMSVQALRWRKDRGWLTSWPVRFWQELERPE